MNVRQLSAHYGGLTAVRGIDLDVKEGEIVALVGSNAAGKSSTIRAISGSIAYEGTIQFDGLELETMTPPERVELGIVQVPEGRRLFQSMTVLENLELGAYSRRARAKRATNLKKAFDAFPRLYERRKQFAGSLSGGEQQMCAIGRGLMSEPALLMLDEPTLGLAPVIVTQVLEGLNGIRDSGVTVLLVEQNVVHSLRLSDRGYVLENGTVVGTGEAAELLESPKLKAAYFGG